MLWFDKLLRRAFSTVIMIMVSIFQQICVAVWPAVCQPVTWIAPLICIFSVFTFLSSAFHFLKSIYFSLFRENLITESENPPCIFLCSFSLLPPASLSSPTFLSIFSDSFSSSSTFSPMRDADALGKVGAAFCLGTFSPLSIKKPGVFCCWPIKGNYDRIMPRGQLWRGKAHVNGQHAVGQQSLVESRKNLVSNRHSWETLGSFFLYTKLSRPLLRVDSRLTASSSDEILTNQILEFLDLSCI